MIWPKIWQASKAPLKDIPARKGVAKQFMFFAGAFFLLCCAVELVKLGIPDQHPIIDAMISVPPLEESDYEELGKIDILRVDSDKQDIKHALSVPQYFSVHDKSEFVINLNPLVKKLGELKIMKQVVEQNLVSEAQNLGPGGPK
jgi:hypothetical protein